MAPKAQGQAAPAPAAAVDDGTALAALAHELRSPLAAIRGFSETLLTHWDSLGDDDKRKLLTAINDDSQRMGRLVAELLDTARVGAGVLRVDPRRFDPGPALERLVARHAAARGKPSVRAIGADALGSLWADPDRFEQVLINLVDNAVIHARSTVEVTLSRAVVNSRDSAVLDVDDDGPGIPVEQREAAFDRYWQAAATPGSGLGLFLVRGIAEGHGGEVTIADSPLGGARLRVVWPNEPER